MVFLGCSFSFSSALFRGAAVKLFVCWSVLAPWRAACIAAGCGFLPLHPVASKVRIKGENLQYKSIKLKKVFLFNNSFSG